jgi:hypothetical protein
MIPTPTQVTPPKRRGSERRDNPRSPLDLAPATLQAVLDALAEREFTPNRRRDLRSAVTRVAKLLGDASARITLELPVLGARLAAISPIAVGLTPKSFSNIRSDLLAAVDASGLRPARSPAKALSPAWSELLAKLPKRREGIGLSRLARYASAQGITPQQVDDAGLAGFITAVREGSFHRQPNVLHRRTAQICK